MGQTTGKHGTTKICGFDADTIRVRGKDLVEDLIGHVPFTEYLYLQATGRSPSPAQSAIVDAVMVTIMEHGLVPSAIVTRLTHYGAPESFQGAVAAGLLGVGDRYAGTAGECGAILERIVAAPADERYERALAEVRRYRETKRPVPGFGHPIHSAHDPRVPRLVEIVREAGAGGEYLAAMDLLEEALAGDPANEKIQGIITAINRGERAGQAAPHAASPDGHHEL